MKIYATSDTHGYLPEIPKDCDLLIHAGDLCPVNNHQLWFQELWVKDNFYPWMRDSAKEAVYIAGNHDFIFEKVKVQRDISIRKVHYLQDDSITVNGLKIYGTPWQPYFHGWAFNLYEEDLIKKWEKIPHDTDILIVHGPPRGCGDLCPRVNKDDDTGWPFEHVGSPSLLDAILERNIKLCFCGHIHSGYGEYMLGNTRVINCSYLNDRYKPHNKPVLIDI